MRWLNTFLYAINGTFTSPSYYKSIIAAPFTFSLKFFYLFFFIFAIVGAIYFNFTLTPKIERVAANIPRAIVEAYPEDLVITITNGEASANVTEPYYIPVSQVEQKFDDVLGATTKSATNLLVIDTNALIENFESYDTYALLTKNNLVYLDNSRLEVVSLKEIENFVINKELVAKSRDSIMPYLRYVAPLVAVGIFLGLFLFVPSANFFYLFFFSVIALVISKLMKYPVSYKKCYQLGMHLIVVYTAIWVLAHLVNHYIEFPLNIPFLRTVILLALFSTILSQLKPTSTS